MNQMVSLTPEMALRLAEVLFVETQALYKLGWFRPLTAEDRGDIWFVSGKVDPKLTLPPDAFGDDVENPVFKVYLVKRDCEVKDVIIQVNFKLSPEVKNEMVATLKAEGTTPAEFLVQRPHGYSSAGIWMSRAFHGGVINSNAAAIQIGRLIFEMHFPARPLTIENIRAELLDGIWHVSGQTDGGSAKLIFRRSNAQVISLDVRSVE